MFGPIIRPVPSVSAHSLATWWNTLGPWWRSKPHLRFPHLSLRTRVLFTRIYENFINLNFFPFFHLHPSLQTLDFAFKREKKFSSGRVASSSRCNQRLPKIAVKFFFAIEKLVHRSFFISRPHHRFPCPSCIVESKIFPRFSSTFDQKYKYRKKKE